MLINKIKHAVKSLVKVASRLSWAGASLVLVLSLVIPLTLSPPQSAKAATLPAYRYTKTFDTSASNSTALGSGVATDSQGNIYVTGRFNGTVVFDGPGGSDSQTSANDSTFLTKYNADGTYGYTKTFDTSAVGSTFALGSGVATDSQGNVYVTGRFRGTVVFDGPGGSDSQTAGGGVRDAYLTKYNADGTYAYTKTFDTSAGGSTFAVGNGVAVDPQDNVYITGIFNGTIVFDGPGGTDSQTSTNESTYLTKYDANGTYAYTKTFDTSASGAFAGGNGVATDSQGNIYVTGDFQDTVIFDGAGGSDSQTSSNEDTFLTKYNANGTYAFTKTFDASASGALAIGDGVAVDPQDNVYITGIFSSTVIFDGPGGSDSQAAGAGIESTFLTKYNANGTYAYTKTFDTSASGAFADGNGVATDSQGNIYVTGGFQDTVTFDGSGGSDSQTSSNGDTFLTKYNANGTYAYTRIFDASASGALAYGSGVAIGSQDNVYITGTFYGTVVFDGPGGSDSRTAANGSSFLTSFQPVIPSGPSPSASSATATPGAPDTGFGVFMTRPLYTLAQYSLASSALIVLAGISRRLTKQLLK